jgi:hypothetical protein
VRPKKKRRKYKLHKENDIPVPFSNESEFQCRRVIKEKDIPLP